MNFVGFYILVCFSFLKKCDRKEAACKEIIHVNSENQAPYVLQLCIANPLGKILTCGSIWPPLDTFTGQLWLTDVPELPFLG